MKVHKQRLSSCFFSIVDSHCVAVHTLFISVKACLIKVAKVFSVVQIIFHSAPWCLFCSTVLLLVVKKIFRCAAFYPAVSWLKAPIYFYFFYKIQSEANVSQCRRL